MISESMQMYLVTIAREQNNRQPVPLSELAQVLSISAVSVNEMCRKLQDSSLVQYQPYKGVSLTEEGDQLASMILRKHRLWEVFLVEKLGLAYEQAHEVACELEHATPNLLADHLDRFLEFPSTNPIGRPIPTSESKIPERNFLSLSRLSAGQSGIVAQVDLPEAAQSYLEDHGLRPGTPILVQAAFNNSCLVKAGQQTLSLDSDLMSHIFLTIQSDTEFQKQSTQPDSHQSNFINKENFMQAEKQTTVKQIPLSELKKGQLGVVVHVGGKGAARRRMLDMGLVTGSEVSVIRIAPLGDPIEFSLKGYSLSLRKSEAETVQVEITQGEQSD
ncbi:MAG: FeoA domain-containing protein [Anaerolineales bacterium]|nr:FeoA domain-containing protein [Anaerolineales bacterium]